MKLVDLTCNHCGAVLKVDADKKQATCDYCGSTILIDDEVQHIQYDNAEEAGYSFEKGRQRAQAEARQAQINNNGMQAQQGSIPNQPSKAKKGSCWRVLLWVFFFPFMFTIFLIKTDKLKLPAKIVLIVLFWIFVLVSGAMNDNTSDETDTDTTSFNTEVDVEKINDVTEQLITAIEKSEENSSDETGIGVVVWQEWRSGYGDVTVHFNISSLCILPFSSCN